MFGGNISMASEFEELLKAQEEQLSKGNMVKGSVVKITDSYIYLDIGYKVEGVVRRYELDDVELGQEIEAVVVRLRGIENPVLSTKPLKSLKGFKIAKEALGNNTPIEVQIEAKAKPGFFVKIEDISALMPFSEAPRNVKVGDKIPVIVTKAQYENGKPFVNVSYRQYEDIEKQQKRQQFLETLKPGDMISGKVVKVDPEKGITIVFGNDIRGFAPSYEIPKNTSLKEGDEVEAKFVRKAKKGDFVILSLKKAKKSNWEDLDIKEGDKLEAKISFYRKGKGLFVELPNGSTAMIPEQSLQSVNKLLKHGAKIKVVITRIDKDKKQIDANIISSEDNLAQEFVKEHPIGSSVKGKVKTVHANVAFIELGENLEGIVKKQDMSWLKNVRSEDILKDGEEKEFMVLGLEGKKVRLGLKQLTQNPWDIIPNKYKPGDQVELVVKEVRPFGTFLGLPEGIDGLLPISEIPKNISLEPGQTVNVRVLEINPKEEKITFSMIQEHKKQAKEEQGQQKDFIKVNDSSSGFRLGDILKNKLK